MGALNSIQLAELCGVSQGTVYRALSGKGRIKEETKKHILKMAETHGYRPNPLADEMIRGKSRLVGAVLPVWEAPFYIDLLNAVQKKLADEGLTLLLATAEDEATRLRILDEFYIRRFNAVFLIPPTTAIKIPKNIQEGLNLISLVNPVKYCRNVMPDEEQCGRLGTEYLIQKKHRRIVRVNWNLEMWAARMRNNGYVETMKKHGLTPSFFSSDYSGETASEQDRRLGNMLKKERPTALFCHNDILAHKIILSLARLGLSVPRDISVLGTDANPAFLQINAHLDSLIYPMQAVAEQCAKTVAGKLKRASSNKPKFEIHRGNTVAEAGN